MKVLVIGGGGREHALVWKIAQSPSVDTVYAAPGSDAIAKVAKCVPIKVNEVEKLAQFAETEGIELTMVGPEDPLTLGIVDAFTARGLKIVGPNALAAQIEGSKAFSKDLMKRHGIPTAAYETAKTLEEARDAVERIGLPVVIKADGLAAGKGVILCYKPQDVEQALDEILVSKRFGKAGDVVVVEKLLIGEEASFIALTDGKTVLPMASSQDHKRVFNDDQGPNTGGMGAYSPAPVITPEMHDKIMETVMIPTIEGMEKDGTPFSGVLYAGLMICEGVPYVLEFNCRFGDPETQPIMARLKSDLVELLLATAEGRLADVQAEWDTRPAVCVVMASGGYPGKADAGHAIAGLDQAEQMQDLTVFHAGTKLVDGVWQNSGGRVLGVTALGDNIQQAVERSYEATNIITWENVHYRSDIARRAFGRM